MNGWARLENIITLLVCAALVLGLYAMGAGWWGLGLIVLFNLNYPRSKS